MRIAIFVVLAIAASAIAASKDLGNGFTDHGVAAPISNHRGTVATVDGNGRNVVLSWLMDHRGGYELLLIDATTGKAEESTSSAARTCAVTSCRDRQDDLAARSILSDGHCRPPACISRILSRRRLPVWLEVAPRLGDPLAELFITPGPARR